MRLLGHWRRVDPIDELAEQIYFFAVGNAGARRDTQVVVADDVSVADVVDFLGSLFEADEVDVLHALGRLQRVGLLGQQPTGRHA